MEEPDKNRGRSKPDQFATRLTERSEPEAGIREAFEEARPRSREDIMLDVRLRDGSRHAFNYAYLIKMEYVPKDRIRMQFGTTQVDVEGRRLHGFTRP